MQIAKMSSGNTTRKETQRICARLGLSNKGGSWKYAKRLRNRLIRRTPIE